MAVTQISKIQVRYGLQADIGNLAAGEFAWAIDTQRLFIGNGDISQGAPFPGMTEIATGTIDISQILGNYVYQGLLGGYKVNTGPTPNSDTTRQLHDKIDDFVNVRDFGAAGTGNVDDTAAIQRAIDQLYNRLSNAIPTRTRRQLRFNAGTYRIDGDLRIPPYCSIIGEGKDNVKLLLSGNKIKLATSIGGDTSIPNTSAEFPKGVSIRSLTINSTADADLFEIDGVDGILFEDVAFVGPRSMPGNIGNQGAGVVVKSSINTASDINFTRCDFTNTSYALHIESQTGTNNINFVACTFRELYKAINTINSGTAGIKDIKITDSLFADICSNAIYGDHGVTGIVSMGNTYRNVASNYNGDLTPASVWSPILVFQADNNYSIADVFERTLVNSYTHPRIQADGYKIASLSIDDAFRLGHSYTTAGNRVTVPSGNIGSFNLFNLKHGIINYSATRGNNVRTGTIKCTGLLTTNSGVEYDDEYVETTDIGLTLSVDKPADTLRLNWSATGTGTDIVLTFDTKTLY